MIERRDFLTLPSLYALVPKSGKSAPHGAPTYHTVSPHAAAANPGMPGPYRGRVVRIQSDKSLDEASDKIDTAIVKTMISAGMCKLTGESDPKKAWQKFFVPEDVIAIKVNCVGFPLVFSSPEIVAEIVHNLTALGVRPENIVLYDRFTEHLVRCGYDKVLPAGVRYHGAEALDLRGGNLAYDPLTYVEVDFFGEDDTRSNVMRLLTDPAHKITKIINVPNAKDHGAAGVTGCLKNVAYGSYSNVARSHTDVDGTTHTRTFIGELCAAEPVRSKTVLQIMDALRGVWHGGPFATKPYRFYPKQIMVGTDPVAIDTIMLDVIDGKRKAQGAISVWERDRKYLKIGNTNARNTDPNVNILIREPGHIAYAGELGLGVASREHIRLDEIKV